MFGTGFVLGPIRILWAVPALLILVAYGPSLAHLIATTPLTTPGFRVW